MSSRQAAVKLLAAAPQDHQHAQLVRPRAGRVNDQYFLGEELECSVSFHVNGVPEAAVNCWKYCDDLAALVDVGCTIDNLANCKLRHQELLLELSKLKRLSPPIG